MRDRSSSAIRLVREKHQPRARSMAPSEATNFVACLTMRAGEIEAVRPNIGIQLSCAVEVRYRLSSLIHSSQRLPEIVQGVGVVGILDEGLAVPLDSGNVIALGI